MSTDRWIETCIAEAEAGDYAYAYELIARAAEGFQCSQPLNEHLLTYLATAFNLILEGEPPERALNLTKRGRRKKHAEQRDMALAARVRHIQETQKASRTAAISTVSADTGWAEKTVERACITYLDAICLTSADEMAELLTYPVNK